MHSRLPTKIALHTFLKSKLICSSDLPTKISSKVITTLLLFVSVVPTAVPIEEVFNQPIIYYIPSLLTFSVAMIDFHKDQHIEKVNDTIEMLDSRSTTTSFFNVTSC